MEHSSNSSINLKSLKYCNSDVYRKVFQKLIIEIQYYMFNIFLKGPSIKDVCNQGVLSSANIWRTEGVRGVFRCGRPQFTEQKISDFF